jgi:hypothetical protein
MKTARETVKCNGKVYSMKAWRVAYEYISDNKAPDLKFERRMKTLGISRSNAYTLYSTQLYKPWEISFSKRKNAKSGLHISVGLMEKVPVQRARKR